MAPPLSAGFIMIFGSFLKSTKLGWERFGLPGWRMKRLLDLEIILPAVRLEVVSQILLMGV